MATGTLQAIKNGIMAIGLAASLAAAGLGFTSSAEARVPEGDRMSDDAQICGWIQDRYDELKGKLQNETDAAKRAELFSQVTTILGAWREQDCDDKYGSIAAMVIVPDVIKNQNDIKPAGGASTEGNPGKFGHVLTSQPTGATFQSAD